MLSLIIKKSNKTTHIQNNESRSRSIDKCNQIQSLNHYKLDIAIEKLSLIDLYTT